MGLRFRLNLTPPGASDVVKRVVEISQVFKSSPDPVPVIPKQTIELGGTVTQYEFVVERNTLVTVTVKDVDGDGNESPITTTEFSAVDTFPPPAPTLTVEALGQE